MSACSDDGFARWRVEVALLRCTSARPGADTPEIGWSAVEFLPADGAPAALEEAPAGAVGSLRGLRDLAPLTGPQALPRMRTGQKCSLDLGTVSQVFLTCEL
jgi:hypothetical protein